MRLRILPFFYALFLLALINTFYITNTSFSTGNAGANCSTSNCHGNDTDGTISFTGIPGSYTPSTSYPVNLCITENEPFNFDIEGGGFTVFVAEVADGSWTSGSGSKLGGANNLAVTHAAKKQITPTGNGDEGQVCWSFTWNAPAANNGTVNFTFRGNAVDCMNDRFGDHGGYFGTTSSTEAATMPVELLGFQVQNENERVKLSWQTATEHQNDFFEIQRSTDGTDFEIIGKIAGAGESLEVLNYEFVDERPIENQKNYYRLRQVDFDENFSFSNIEFIDLKRDKIEFEVFPNPTADFVSLKISDVEFENLEVKILNATNQTILSKIISYQNETIDLSGLPNGFYTICMENKGQIFSKRILKI